MIAKRLCLSLALAVVATLLIVMPVLAAYFAYIYVEESDGNSYVELPVICPTNITRLVQGGYISTTGRNTRVLTGSGESLPHMLTQDSVLFTTDLAAYEDRTLIFYLGATSLSSFPIIVGYNGTFVTPDDPDLELGYVMELLIAGYFNADAGDVGHNILYKEDALRIWISAANTIKVAALNSTGDEQWEAHYGTFNTGYHTVYIVCNGLWAYLYVDTFDVAKDTANLFAESNVQLASVTDGAINLMHRRTFYAEGRWWAFYRNSSNKKIYFTSSLDGTSWDAPTEIVYADIWSLDSLAVCSLNATVHMAWGCTLCSGSCWPGIYYQMGTIASNGTISWCAKQLVTAGELATDEYLHGYSIAVDGNGYPYVLWGHVHIHLLNNHSAVRVSKSSTNNGTWTVAGGYPQDLDYADTSPYYSTAHYCYIAEYQNTTNMYAVYSDDGSHGSSTAYALKGKYYNGASWAGTADTIFDGYSLNLTPGQFNAVCDDLDNMYIVWSTNATNIYMRIRYSDGSWGDIIAVASNATYPSISYSPATHCIYITFISGNYVYGVSLVNGEISHSGVIFEPPTISGATMVTSGYSQYLGILFGVTSSVQHAIVGFYWEWNDNNYDWEWDEANVMPYIDDIQLAVDGVTQLEYKPDSIIQGTTLPDEESDHDADITWGTNPSGVDVSMSELQTDSSYNQTYYYQYMNPGNPDIIKPETAEITSDVDLEKLHDNPLYPLVRLLVAPGILTERLVWLGLAWFFVIAAMFAVHLGFDTHPDTEKPQHFILTTITGLGLSILFYSMGIFNWAVLALMALGLVCAIIWERQPVL